DVTLPEWQLEPDDEAMTGSPEDYYYVDEQGNLIDPSHQGAAAPVAGPRGRVEDNGAAPQPDGGPPPAANDDFLDQATGKQGRRGQ
ncbi:hypothetical protein ABTN14_18980, partial [Acinetobacter baumannii]